MVSQGNDTCRVIFQTAFGLSGQTQPALPNGQTPQVPASTEAVSKEGKPHVSIEGKAANAQVLALCQGQDPDQQSQHRALGYGKAGGKGIKERRDEETGLLHRTVYRRQ